MFGLGTTEMVIILVLVLIVFGAGKLPQVAASLGKGVRNFKDGMDPKLIDDEMTTEERKKTERFFGTCAQPPFPDEN